MSSYSFFVEKTGNQFFLRRSDGTSYVYTNAPTNNPSFPQNIMICGGFIDDELTSGGLLVELQVETNATCCSGIQYSVNNTNNWVPLSGIFVDFFSSSNGLVTECNCQTPMAGRLAIFDGKEFVLGTTSEHIVSNSGNDSHERWNYFPAAFNGHAFEYRRSNFDQTLMFEYVTVNVTCEPNLPQDRWRVDFVEVCYLFESANIIDQTENRQTGYLDCSQPLGGVIDIQQQAGYPQQYDPNNQNPCSPKARPSFTILFPEAETDYTLHPSCLVGEPANCDNRIVKLAVPGSILSPNGTRASMLYVKMGGSGTNCTEESNVVEIPVPPLLPDLPPPDPEVCLPSGTDLYGYTATVSYSSGDCGVYHACDRALFDLYINNTLIGQANLNNKNNGGARSSTFTILDHIIATTGLTISLNCASPSGICHKGIGRVEIKDMQPSTVFAACLPNDTVNARIVCEDISNNNKAYPCAESGVFTSQPTDQVLVQQDGATATFTVGINNNIPRETWDNWNGMTWLIGYVYNSGTPYERIAWQPLHYAYSKESLVPLFTAAQAQSLSFTITYKSSDIWTQGGYTDPGIYGYNKSFPSFNIYDARFQFVVIPSGLYTNYDGIPCSSDIVKLTRG